MPTTAAAARVYIYMYTHYTQRVQLVFTAIILFFFLLPLSSCFFFLFFTCVCMYTPFTARAAALLLFPREIASQRQCTITLAIIQSATMFLLKLSVSIIFLVKNQKFSFFFVVVIL